MIKLLEVGCLNIVTWNFPGFLCTGPVTDVEFFSCSEGLLGVAIISGVALAAGVVGSALWRGMAKRR